MEQILCSPLIETDQETPNIEAAVGNEEAPFKEVTDKDGVTVSKTSLLTPLFQTTFF